MDSEQSEKLSELGATKESNEAANSSADDNSDKESVDVSRLLANAGVIDTQEPGRLFSQLV